MIRHLFKLVWNRKGSNFLIVLEIFVSFLVVFSLAATGIYTYRSYGQPLGFQWQDVWIVRVDRNVEGSWGQWSPEEALAFRRLMEAAESSGEVVSVAGVTTAPYSGSTEITELELEGSDHRSEISRVTPELAKALRLQLVEGRWFEPGDEAMDWTPVVIDSDLAAGLAGGESPLGLRLEDREEEMRVIGVVSDFRRRGEFADDEPYTLALASLEDPETATALEELVIRLEPGTPAAFEEDLLSTLQSIARGWTFTVTHLEEARATHFKEKLVPLAAVGVVAGFLLFMVVLGLTGVMWQNVIRRTREFGLRRAVGAHRTRIQRQIVGEVAVTAALGLLAGGLLAAQVPLVGPFTFVPWSVVLMALASASGLILLLSAICGLYPGWTATRIHPAEALHYE